METLFKVLEPLLIEAYEDDERPAMQWMHEMVTITREYLVENKIEGNATRIVNSFITWKSKKSTKHLRAA